MESRLEIQLESLGFQNLEDGDQYYAQLRCEFEANVGKNDFIFTK